jgi:hypothetical protein
VRAASTSRAAFSIAVFASTCPFTSASSCRCRASVAAGPPSTVGNGVAFSRAVTYDDRNGVSSWAAWASRSEARLGRMPIDIRMSAIADEPLSPESGPLR